MRILALDLGDRWVGSAISDPLGITSRPYKTVPLSDLFDFLTGVIKTENIGMFLVGYPQTLRGTESEQTKTVIALYEKIKEAFPTINVLLCDERFTSKQAAQLKKASNKDEKLLQHSVAAALILTTYLDLLQFQKNE